jgi:hypothetical protein
MIDIKSCRSNSCDSGMWTFAYLMCEPKLQPSTPSASTEYLRLLLRQQASCRYFLGFLVYTACMESVWQDIFKSWGEFHALLLSSSAKLTAFLCSKCCPSFVQAFGEFLTSEEDRLRMKGDLASHLLVFLLWVLSTGVEFLSSILRRCPHERLNCQASK